MIDDPKARTVLRRVVPGYEPTDIELPTQGNYKTTIVARYADHPDAVVQLTDAPAAAHTEATLLAAIRERTGVPVPRLLARGSLGDRGYIVTEHVAGADLHERFAGLDADRQAALARRFGAALAQLHEAFRFETAGPVTVGATGRLHATGPAADDFFAEYARAGVDALPAAFDDLVPAVEAALDGRPDRDSDPRLFPWDLRPGNAVLADGDLAAVLDWGDPLAADPALAVAKVEHLVAAWYADDPAPLRTAFREGYESVRPLPSVSDADRVAAVVRSAVDSEGVVTRPRYPELTGDDAVAVHREWLSEWL